MNSGGDVRELDFQFNVADKKIGAPFHGLKAFFTTPQLSTIDKVIPVPCFLQYVLMDRQVLEDGVLAWAFGLAYRNLHIDHCYSVGTQL